MRWDVVEILESADAALRVAAAEADAEQAVYGIDALDELGLHPIIQQGLRDAGFGVWPEQAYPSARTARRRKSEGQRCDVVLSPSARPLVDPEAEATLFSPEDALALENAYWLEIKTVSMFTTEGPFARYSAELLSPVRSDIRKLAQDPLIYHAGLLLVLFTTDRDTAEHDLAVWEHRVLSKGYPVAPPIVRHTDITDRLGNAHMAVAQFPVRRL
jgi:hypothetical protein